MARPPRAAEGGLLYHTLNRANVRLTIFENEDDYDTFVGVLAETVERYGTRLLAYCVLPNHFHLVLWPKADGELSDFMRWLTLTHTQRWHAHHGSTGSGHVYQGRFKAFPVQSDEHFLTVSRYVERNALRGLGVAGRGVAVEQPLAMVPQGEITRAVAQRDRLANPPPATVDRRVNAAFSPEEEEAVRRSIQRGQPLGTKDWQIATAKRLGLESTFRRRGRPKKDTNNRP